MAAGAEPGTRPSFGTPGGTWGKPRALEARPSVPPPGCWCPTAWTFPCRSCGSTSWCGSGAAGTRWSTTWTSTTRVAAPRSVSPRVPKPRGWLRWGGGGICVGLDASRVCFQEREALVQPCLVVLPGNVGVWGLSLALVATRGHGRLLDGAGPQKPLCRERRFLPAPPGGCTLSDGWVGCTRGWVQGTGLLSPPRCPHSSQTSVESAEPAAASAARGPAVPGPEGGRPQPPARAAGQPLPEPPAPRHLGGPCPPRPAVPRGFGWPGRCQPSAGASAAPEGPFGQVSAAEMLRAPNCLASEQLFSHPGIIFSPLPFWR